MRECPWFRTRHGVAAVPVIGNVGPLVPFILEGHEGTGGGTNGLGGTAVRHLSMITKPFQPSPAPCVMRGCAEAATMFTFT